MSKKSESVTAAELIARLNSDPELVAKRTREERVRQQQAESLRRAEMPLVEELRGAGYDVNSVWDLVNTSASYEAALPVLLSHLLRPYPEAIREGIARALAVPDAKKLGWDVLVRQYASEKDGRVKDGLAVAIAAAADREVIGEVIELAMEAQHGPSRLLLLHALERFGDGRAVVALESLQTDAELEKEVAIVLARMGKQRS